MNIFKSLYIILILLFSLNVNAADSTSVEECKISYENLANKSLDRNTRSTSVSYKEEVSDLMIKTTLKCADKLLIDNTVNNLLYQTIGDPYKQAVNMAVIPFNGIFNFMQNIINTDIENDAFKELKFNKDESNRDIFGAGTFNLLLTDIMMVVNYVVLVLVIFIIILYVYKNKKGDFTKENIKNIKRLIFALALVSPLPFLANISLIQFLILIVVAFSSMVANIFYIFIYSMIYIMDISTFEDPNRNINYFYEKEVIFLSENSNLKDTYNKSVNAEICLIENMMSDLEKNITDTKDVAYSKELSWEDSDKKNFFNCLVHANSEFNNNPTINQLFLNNQKKLEYCALNYGFYFKFSNGNKVPLKIGNYNCGTLNNISDELSTNVFTKLQNGTYISAKRYYDYNCKYNENVSKNVNKVFKCVEMSEFGNFQLSPVPSMPDVLDIKNINSDTSVNALKKEEEFKNIKKEEYKSYLASVHSIYTEKIGSSVTEHEENMKKNMLIYKNSILISNLNNGWLNGYSIFIPKQEFNTYWFDEGVNFFKNLVSSGISSIGKLFTGNNLDVDSNFYKVVSTIKNINYNIDETLIKEKNNLSYNDIEEFNASSENSNMLFLGFINNIDLFDASSYSFKNPSFKKFADDCVYKRECSITHTNPITQYYVAGTNMLDMGMKLYFLVKGWDETAKLMKSNFAPPNIVVSGAVKIAVVMIGLGVFGSMILIVIPFLYFVSIILNWLYQLIKSIIVSNILVIYIMLPNERDEDIIAKNATESKIYKILGQLLFVPTFLIIGVLVAYISLYLIVSIINITIFMSFSIFGFGGNPLLNFVEYFILLIVYFAIIGLVTIKISKKMQETIMTLNKYLSLDVGNLSGDDFQGIIAQLQRRIFIVKN